MMGQQIKFAFVEIFVIGSQLFFAEHILKILCNILLLDLCVRIYKVGDSRQYSQYQGVYHDNAHQGP